MPPDTPVEPGDEDQILHHLRDALDHQHPTTAEDIAMVMTGYDIVQIDTLIADLVEDTAVAAGTRGEPIGARLITYRSGEQDVALEIVREAPHVVGHLDPPRAGTVTLEQVGYSETRPLGELGEYEFALPTTAPFRLRFVPDEGQSFSTDWIVP